MIRTNNPNINTKTYWNTIYADDKKRQEYLDHHTSGVGGTETNRFSKALEYVKKGDSFIDLGCGVGVMTKMVKDKYPETEVWGVDISDVAMTANAKERPTIAYRQGYIGNLKDIPDNHFYVVFSGETLEHLDDPNDLFKDAHKLLKEAGMFILTTPNGENIKSPEHTWIFEHEDIEQLYLNNGFQRIEFVYLPDMEHLYVIFAVGYKE